MTPNVSSAPNATPAGSNWNLPATRVSGQSAPSDPSSGKSADAAAASQPQPQPQDSIEIGKTPNATTLPSLAVITQRIISEIRTDAKNQEKRTNERRAQDESDRRDAELRQREEQAVERKQMAQKIDAARLDSRKTAAPQPKPEAQAAQPKAAPAQAPSQTQSTHIPQDPRPGDPANPSILHAQEIQEQGAKALTTLSARTTPIQPPQDLAPAPEVAVPKSASPIGTMNVMSTASSLAPPSSAAPISPPVEAPARAPESNPTELLHTITSQLSSSSLNEMSSVHLLSVNFQS